jgi:hypothetical protein
MTLQVLHSEFPYILGKYFLFISVPPEILGGECKHMCTTSIALVQRKIAAPVYRGPDPDLVPTYKLDLEYFIFNYRMVLYSLYIFHVESKRKKIEEVFFFFPDPAKISRSGSVTLVCTILYI